jgi:hypothetical protein
MKFTTNMTRTEVEALLVQCKAFADTANLTDVAKLIDFAPGTPSLELSKRVHAALAMLGGEDEYALLIDRLDMLTVNIANLKD